MEVSLNEEWRGCTTPEQYKILFAVGKFSNTLLNYSEKLEWWMDAVGSDKMEDLALTNPTDIPKITGVYTGLLTVIHRRVSSNPMESDGEEWETEMTLSSCMLINKLEL